MIQILKTNKKSLEKNLVSHYFMLPWLETVFYLESTQLIDTRTGGNVCESFPTLLEIESSRSGYRLTKLTPTKFPAAAVDVVANAEDFLHYLRGTTTETRSRARVRML